MIQTCPQNPSTADRLFFHGAIRYTLGRATAPDCLYQHQAELEASAWGQSHQSLYKVKACQWEYSYLQLPGHLFLTLVRRPLQRSHPRQRWAGFLLSRPFCLQADMIKIDREDDGKYVKN